jgi:hypothetical protein
MPTQNPHRTAGLCTSSKVYSALTELKHLEGHRSAKFLALLAETWCARVCSASRKW